MSEKKIVSIPINIRDWVLAVDVGPIRRQRRAIEIALNTIATCDDLANSCSLKGGILMGLLHGSPRLTGDIDLSLTAMPSPESPEEFGKTLDAHFDFVALELGYPNIAVKVHSIKKQRGSKFDTSEFPALKLKLNFVERNNETQFLAFNKGIAIEIIEIDVSYNEPAKDIVILKLSNERELLAYGLAELIAEKLRALHQQVTKHRNRNRRQDAYDIWWLYENNKLTPEDYKTILKRLRDKSIDRGVEIDSTSINNPEIEERAKADWETQKLEIGDDLPEFEECWEAVLALYSQLPW